MNELHEALDKLFTEVDHLDRITACDEPNVQLALSVAKRVRRETNVVVRALARQRDQLQP